MSLCQIGNRIVRRDSQRGGADFSRIRSRTSLTRRRLLTAAAASVSMPLLGGLAAPRLSRAADRPLVSHGVQSGDVSLDSGVVWARADRPARMQVEVATTESFKDSARRVRRRAPGDATSPPRR